MGLIEVLVAVLVLAIGLLGIAMMQTRALSSNNSSMARTTAVVASYSMFEIMRADRANALASAYNTTTLSGSNCGAGTGSLAQNQLTNWCTNLVASLGGAPSAISATINCSGAGVCSVSITFDDSKVGNGATTTTVVTQAAL